MVLDGRNGQPITNTLTASIPVFSSPLTVSMEGKGNDLFVYWIADCLKKGNVSEILNINSTADEIKARKDCEKHGGLPGYSALYVTNRKKGLSSGKLVYSSGKFKVSSFVCLLVCLLILFLFQKLLIFLILRRKKSLQTVKANIDAVLLSRLLI